jgi:hypothetical protein
VAIANCPVQPIAEPLPATEDVVWEFNLWKNSTANNWFGRQLRCLRVSFAGCVYVYGAKRTNLINPSRGPDNPEKSNFLSVELLITQPFTFENLPHAFFNP